MKLPISAFKGAMLKVERAYRHIDELKFRIERFIESDFYSIRIESDPDEGESLVYGQTVPIDADIPLSLGDAAHNLRASLDFCWMTLVRAHTSNANARRGGLNQFPFHETRENLKDAIDKAPIKASFPEIEGLILDDIQPYMSGKFPLWAVNKLDNMDKHNLLVPAVAFGKIKRLVIETDIGGMCVMENVGLAGHRLKLVGGASFKGAKVKQHDKAPAQVVFEDGQVFERQPLLPTMIQAAQAVREAVELFPKTFC